MLRCTLPNHGNVDKPCGVEQGSKECFKIACPQCKKYQEKDDADKYTDENILLEVKNATDGLLFDLVPEDLGRPLCTILIGDNGFYLRSSPAFDGDYDNLIACLTDVIEDLKERPLDRV
jgi:hypothetical protein